MDNKHRPLSTDAAIRKYLDSRRIANEPISLADAVRTIRIVVPGCEMTDSELGDIVARCAIAKRLTVNFDQRGAVSVYDLRYARPLPHRVGNASASSISVH